MKFNPFLFLGLTFIALLTLVTALSVGKFQEAYFVDWPLVAGTTFLLGLPFGLGFFAGRYKTRDGEPSVQPTEAGDTDPQNGASDKA